MGCSTRRRNDMLTFRSPWECPCASLAGRLLPVLKKKQSWKTFVAPHVPMVASVLRMRRPYMAEPDREGGDALLLASIAYHFVVPRSRSSTNLRALAYTGHVSL